MIEAITPEGIRSLSVSGLATRMDRILMESIFERFGANHPKQPLVSEILSTEMVQAMEEDKQRTVCHLTFKMFLQMQYTMEISSCTSSFIFGTNYDENESWRSPTIQIRSAASKQHEIISSRISMEYFMQLLHFIGVGEEITNKSKFRGFKKWLNDTQNPFSYFATHLLRAFFFDRQHRTPEVHASSRLSAKVLMMKRPTYADLNTPLALGNAMLNIWQPLLDILNNNKPNVIYGDDEDFQWLQSYVDDNDEKKAKALQDIFDQMK